jgi:hypothetical protein
MILFAYVTQTEPRAGRSSGKISKISTEQKQEVGTIDVGGQPAGIEAFWQVTPAGWLEFLVVADPTRSVIIVPVESEFAGETVVIPTPGFGIYGRTITVVPSCPTLPCLSTPAIQKPPFSCCERNIRFEAGKEGHAWMVVGQEYKYEPETPGGPPRFIPTGRLEVKVYFELPIVWDCNKEKNQACIGTFNVEVDKNPKQADATGKFTVDPVAGSVSVTSSWRASEEGCDGKANHKGVITISYEAIYPAFGADVQGTLKLTLSVPKDKGTINHELSAEIQIEKGKAPTVKVVGPPKEKK